MKIQHDAVKAPYAFPLQEKECLRCLRELAPEAVEAVGLIRFKCNRRTTREGRVVRRGRRFEVTVNFCPREGRTRVLAATRRFLEPARRFGGVVDAAAGSVAWSPAAARNYTLFLLFHEIGHVVWALTRPTSDDASSHPSEEAWCDAYALAQAERAAALLDRS